MEEKNTDITWSGRKKGIIIAVICLAVILAAAVGVYAYTQEHKNDQAKEDKPGTETEKKEEALPDPTNVTDEASLRKLLAADGAIDITVTGEVRTARTFEVKGNKTLRGQGAVAADYDIGVATPLINVKKGASLTVDGLRLDGAGAATVISVDEGAKLSHVSGRIEYAGGFAVSVAGEAALSQGTEILDSSDGALHVLEDGKLTLDGGTYKENGNYGLMVSPGGKCEINGEPVFDGAMRAIVWNQGETRIYGGTYTNSNSYGIRNSANMTVDYRGAKKGGKIEISNTENYGMYVESTSTLYVYDVVFRNMTGGYCFRKSGLFGMVRVKNCVFDKQTKYNTCFNVEGGNVVMDNVELMHAGGGMYLCGDGTITLRDVKVHDLSTSAATAGWGHGGNSDAIRADGPKVKGDRVTIWNIGGAPLVAKQGVRREFYLEYGSIDMKNLTVYGCGRTHIYPGCSLKITDSLISGKEDAPTNNVGIQIDKDATFVMNGNTVIRGSKGRGVIVNGGVFTMNSGKICDNRLTEKSSDSSGGAVFVQKSGSQGRFIMNGGEITGNESVYRGTDYPRQRGAAVCVWQESSFIMNGGSIHGNRGGQGPVLVRINSLMTMNGGKIYDNSAREGGGILVIDKSRMVMNGGSITNNVSEGGGAGVYLADSAILDLNAGLISGNNAGGSGGGVNVVSKGAFNFSGGVIEKNHAASGGAVGIGGGGTARITGGKISENEAVNEGGGIRSSESFSVRNCVFRDNRAGIGAVKNGGAIFAEGGANRNVTLSNSKFIGNHDELNCGGAICNAGVTMTIKGCDFEKNHTATGQGGAIYQNNAAGKMTISDSTFKDNTTGNFNLGGAAICVNNGVTNGPCLVVTDTTFENNIQEAHKDHWNNNQAHSNGGGAVYLTGANLSATFTATKPGIKFKGNISKTGNGGAIYSEIKEIAVTGYEFEGNESVRVEMIQGGSGTNANDKVKIGGCGGAIYTTSSLTLDKCFFGAKDTRDADANAEAANRSYQGGAVYAKGQSANISDTSFIGNKSDHAGGAVLSNTNLTVEGGTFENNECAVKESSNGGAIFAEGGTNKTVTLSNSKFIGNHDELNCGGAICNAGVTMTIKGCDFEKNHTATGQGGAIYQNNAAGKMTISDSTFKDNTTGNFNLGGAAICVNNGVTNGPCLVVTDTTFENNIQEAHKDHWNNNQAHSNGGGAVYLTGANLSATFTATKPGIKFKGNISKTGNGGAIYADMKEVTVKGYEFEGNEAVQVEMVPNENSDPSTAPKTKVGGNGGAIYATSSLILDGCSFGAKDTQNADTVAKSANKAAANGGAVYVDSAGKAEVKGESYFAGNRAYQGGAVYANGQTANISGATFIGNKSDNAGGAVYSNTNLTVDGGTFNDNECAVKESSNGGAIFAAGGTNKTVTLSNSKFTGNHDELNCGGAICNAGVTMTIKGCDFEKNHTATGQGGAIYQNNAAGKMTISDSTFKDNTTGNFNLGGAAICVNNGVTNGPCLVVTDTTFENNIQEAHKDHWNNNQAHSNGGGAVYLTGANLSATFTATKPGIKFKGNISKTGNGGAIYADMKEVTVTGYEFEGNESVQVEMIQGGKEPNANDKVKVGGNGGAIYAKSSLILDKCSFGAKDTQDADTVAGAANKAAVNGGAVYVDSAGKAEVKGESCFAGNRAYQGGAVYAKGQSANISGATFIGNKSDYHGGAVYSNTNLTVDGGTFENNECAVKESSNGGAIFAAGGTNKTVTLSNSKFIGNHNERNCGGAISNGAVTMIITGCSFEENHTATGQGGAIYQNDPAGKMTISDSTFKDNTTGNFNLGGAAICVNNGVTNEPCLVVIDTTFENNIQEAREDSRNNNQAKANGGGAVYLTGENLSATFTATKPGIKFKGNKSNTGNGGAICNGAANYKGMKEVIVTGYEFEGNEAVQVEMVPNKGDDPTKVDMIKVGGNGGAIYSLTSLTVSGCSFTNNKAAVDGGAICAKNLTLQKNDDTMVTFTGNTAGGKGTAISIMQGGTLTGKGNATLASGQTVDPDPVPTKAAKKKTGTAVKKTSAKTK